MPDLSTVLAVVIEAETQAAASNLNEVNAILAKIAETVTSSGAASQKYGQVFEAATNVVRASIGSSNADLEANANLFRAVITRNVSSAEKLKFAGVEFEKAWQQAFKGMVADAKAAQDAVSMGAEQMAAAETRAAKAISASNKDVTNSLKIVAQMQKDIARNATQGPLAAGKAWEGMGSRAQTSLFGIGQALGRTHGILGQVGTAVNDMSFGLMISNQYASTLARTLAGVGAAMGALGALGLAAAAPLTKAQAQLQQSIEQTKSSYQGLDRDIENAVKKGERFGHNAADTNTALARLTTGFGSASAATKYFGEVADLAAFRHTSLTQAAIDFTRIVQGHYSRGLKDLGISFHFTTGAAKDLETATKRNASAIDLLAKAQERLKEVQDRVAAQGPTDKSNQEAIENATNAHTDAVQRLQDVQDRIAARRADEVNKPDKQYEASQRALERYNAELAKFHGLNIITQEDVDRLHEAQRKKNDEDKKAIEGTAPGGKNVEELNDKIALRDANEAVARSTKNLEEANEKAASGSKGAAADALALKHAQEAVDAAQKKIAKSVKDMADARTKQVKQDAESAQVAAMIAEKVGGQAAKQADSLGGKISGFKAKVDDFIATVGKKYGPAIAGLGGGLNLLGAAMNLAGRKAKTGGELADGAGNSALIGAGKWAGGVGIAAGAGYAIGTAIEHVLRKQPKWNKFWGDFAYNMMYGAEKGNSGVGATLGRLPGVVWKKMQEVWDTITNWGVDIYHSMVAMGKNIIIGLYNGLLEGPKAIWHYIEDLGGGIKQIMQKVFSFGSPSKVMQQYGRWITEGLAEGIRSGTGDALGAATMLADGTNGALQKAGQMRPLGGAVGGNAGFAGAGGAGSNETTKLLKEIRDYLAEHPSVKMENVFNEKVDAQHLAGELAFQIRS